MSSQEMGRALAILLVNKSDKNFTQTSLTLKTPHCSLKIWTLTRSTGFSKTVAMTHRNRRVCCTNNVTCWWTMFFQDMQVDSDFWNHQRLNRIQVFHQTFDLQAVQNIQPRAEGMKTRKSVHGGFQIFFYSSTQMKTR